MTDIRLRMKEPGFINEMKNMEAIDDKGVEGLMIMRMRGLVITYGFDFTHPLNECNIVVGLICSSKKKMEDDEYCSKELDDSYPDESDDEKSQGPKFKKFRKEPFNKDYQFKWGMEFKSLADFRDAIREW